MADHEEQLFAHRSEKYPGLKSLRKDGLAKAEDAIRKVWLTDGKDLSLAHCDLISLPASLGQLSLLRSLDVSGNQVRSLPPTLEMLSNLSALHLSANGLTSVPPSVWKLTQLRILKINENKITTLPEEIGSLSKLECLNAHDNLLASLPEALGWLASLQLLALGKNLISSLPVSLGRLRQLEGLHLEDNRLTSLPAELQGLIQNGKLGHLYLHGNTLLGLPHEVLGPPWSYAQGADNPANALDVLSYYFRSREGDSRRLRELKLILVGRGETGKTTLADVLQGKPFVKERPKTEGIAITPWKINLHDGVEGGMATAHVWDFGGQQIMHGTHQFFMTHRALYLIVLDGRDDRTKQEAEYWLKLVRAFGGESPVLLVLNKQAAHAYDIDRGYFLNKYDIPPTHIFRTECATTNDEGVTALRENILRMAKDMLAARDRFPAVWWGMKQHLGEMRERGEDFLPQEDYHQLCADKGVPKDDRELLLRVLSELGTVVSFPDDVRLAQLHVLNPEWVTDGVYRVLNQRDLLENKRGQLQMNGLRSMLPNERWPRSHHHYLLDLMAKFQLCFPLEGSPDAFLVPELLPDQTPTDDLATWDSAGCLVFLYAYVTLPQGILPRFLTRTHDLSENGLRWRTGVTLNYDGAEALVRADYDTNRITIWVRGRLERRQELLKAIRREFGIIHKAIKGLELEERVAVPGHPDVTALLSEVLADEADEQETIRMTIGGKRTNYPISDLLHGVLTPNDRILLQRIYQRSGINNMGIYDHGVVGRHDDPVPPPFMNHSIASIRGRALEKAMELLYMAHPRGPAQVLRMMDDDANKYITVNSPLPDQWLQVLEAANAGGWTGNLLFEAVRQQPGNRALRQFAASHGIVLGKEGK